MGKIGTKTGISRKESERERASAQTYARLIHTNERERGRAMISFTITALFMSLLALWGITYLALDFDRLINEREGE